MLVTVEGSTFHVNGEAYHVDGTRFANPGDAAVALTLPVCIVKGEDLRIEGVTVSSQLISSLPKIKNIYARWLPVFKAIPQQVAVHAETGPADAPLDAVALFWSGGLDSRYSLAKNRDRVTKLIAVHGFDVPLSEPFDIAGPLSVQKVSTDLRRLSDRFLSWEIYHGAALAAVALLCGYKSAIIGAGSAEWQLHPWGSHPDLDPLWSNGATVIEHDGHEADRPAKVAFIRDHRPDLLGDLRVCWESRTQHNCGRCEKCVRTILDLAITKSSHLCRSLPGIPRAADIR